MIVRALGYLFRAVARVAPGPGSRDLGAVGDELLRLASRPRHPSTSSR